MKHYCRILTAFMILLIAGCASVPMASIDQDTKAKDFIPLPNKPSLYIYRNESFGSEIPITVVVNGKALGQTAAKTYFRLNLWPGRYNIESYAENVSRLSLLAEAEKNYFVWQEVKMGLWMGRSQLHQVDEETGRSGVMESKLIAISISDNDFTPLDTQTTTPTPPQALPADSLTQKLRELQNLRKDGLISEEEFQKKKQQLLDKF